jgi:hypothetical protein
MAQYFRFALSHTSTSKRKGPSGLSKDLGTYSLMDQDRPRKKP